MMTRSFFRRATVAAIALTAAAGLTGCSALSGLFGGATRGDSGEVTEAGDLSAFEYQVGDCLIASDASEISSQKAVPCGDPHDQEVYALFDIKTADDAFPGDDEMNAQIEEGCYGAAFTDFVGISFDESAEWDVYVLMPTEETWNQMHDREVVCSIATVSGEQATGSAKGTAK